MLDLNEEKKLLESGFNWIGGIDEAGRGPLAGPVVAACVLINKEALENIKEDFEFIRDSKKLTAKKREEVFEIIINNFQYGIGMCDHETIDRINILQAAFLAMKKAVGALKQKPDFIVLDGGFPIPNMSVRQKNIIKGDTKVFSIAAASILAKVTRDRLMLKMHAMYPRYRFDKHKGYGTRVHMALLSELGPCPIHRKSFAPVRECMKRN